MPTIRNKIQTPSIYNIFKKITLLHYPILSHSTPQKSEVLVL